MNQSDLIILITVIVVVVWLGGTILFGVILSSNPLVNKQEDDVIHFLDGFNNFFSNITLPSKLPSTLPSTLPSLSLPSYNRSTYIFIILTITTLIMFLLCLFYSPWNEVFKKEVDAASKIMDEYILKKEKREKEKPVVKDIPYVKPKWTNTTKTYNTLIKDTEKLFTEEVWDEKLKKYDTVIKDTESLPTKEPSIDAWKETIRKYSENIPEKIYEEQLKNVWVEALSKQNRYYLLGFTLLSLLPFFYFLIYILTHTVPEIDIFIQRPFSFLMVILTVFYTAVILMLYTVTKKTYATIIPILLFFFLAGILYFQKYLHVFTTLGIFAICIVESFLVFYNVAFAWCLIPLLPLFFLLFILYTQQQR